MVITHTVLYAARVQVVSQLESRRKAPRTIRGLKVEEEGREAV
jgi:hypothetical protein